MKHSWLHNTSILIPICPHLQCYQPLIQSRSRSASGDKSTAMGLTGPHNLAKVSVHLEKGKEGKLYFYDIQNHKISSFWFWFLMSQCIFIDFLLAQSQKKANNVGNFFLYYYQKKLYEAEWYILQLPPLSSS